MMLNSKFIHIDTHTYDGLRPIVHHDIPICFKLFGITIFWFRLNISVGHNKDWFDANTGGKHAYPIS